MAIIDVFCHALPPAFVTAVRELNTGPKTMFERATAMPVMVDLNARFRVMDLFEDYRQVISLASPVVESLGEPSDAARLARIGNAEMAQWVQDHPDRFVGHVASLPMSDINKALKEIHVAVAQEGALGIQLYTNVLGRPLDAPEFRCVFETMAELKRPIWLHPIRAANRADYASESISKYDLWWAFGWPHETSVAMGRLVYAGIFDRWPELTIITHHAGGTLPMIGGRLQANEQLLGSRYSEADQGAAETSLKEPPNDALRRFYADTATFGSATAIRAGLDYFGLEHMLFASDMPFDPEQGPGNIQRGLQAIAELNLTPIEKEQLLNGNATRLFNRP